MKLKIISASKALVEATPEDMDRLRKELSYVNKSNQHQLKRHYSNHWFRSQNLDGWTAHLEALKNSVHKTVIFDEGNEVYIRPGSIPYLADLFGGLSIENDVKYPTPKKIPWAKPLPFELHPYQLASAEKLIEIKHGNVELATGSGKSAILLKVCRETGFRTAIVAPSKSIFLELLEKFQYHFGKGIVGTFGNGKKLLGKRFTICIGDSVANVKEGTPEWDFFSKLDMLCVDESHTWGADTLEEICHGVLADVPYRLFFSGTQTRGDGAEKLLQSIIGKTAYLLTTQEAVAGGYICPHEYRIVEVESSNPNYMTADALDMKRAHFLNNRNICELVARLANAEATTRRRQTLILVEELSQIAALLPLLKVPTAIAHSEKRSDRLAELGLMKVNPEESVERFNKGEAMVLLGTSCISTGTNIYPVHNCVNWVGGASEIKTKQGAIGRSVRLDSQNPWKDRCTRKDKAIIWDFLVSGVTIMERHLDDRVRYYSHSGSEIKFIKLSR